MTYKLIPLLSIFLLTGCGGASGGSLPKGKLSNNSAALSSDNVVTNTINNTSDITPDSTVNTDGAETATKSNQTDIDNSLITCEDNLSNVLSLINQLRAQPQTCGKTDYPAVGKVRLNSTLTSAATEHSNNMANDNFFSHTGLDGGSVGNRVTAKGYTWRRVSENIAGGLNSAQSVVDGWMSSEGHCTNIMNAEVTEMGLACQVNSEADYQYYWTQVFAKPR